MIDEFAEFQYVALQNIERQLKNHADPYIFVQERATDNFFRGEMDEWLNKNAPTFCMYTDHYYPATDIPWFSVQEKGTHIEYAVPITVVIVDGEDLAFQFRLWFGEFQRLEFDRFIDCLTRTQTFATQRRWLEARSSQP